MLCQYRKNVGVVDGLTLDVEDDLLYWTDVTNKMIERANLNGRNRKPLLQGLDKPRAIVLYKAKRFVLIFFIKINLHILPWLASLIPMLDLQSCRLYAHLSINQKIHLLQDLRI